MPFFSSISNRGHRKDHYRSGRGRLATVRATQNPLPAPFTSPPTGGIYTGLASCRDRVLSPSQRPLQFFPYWMTAVCIFKT